MKKTIIIILGIISAINSIAQQKDFEGTIVYDVKVKSKSKIYDDKFYKLFYEANGDKLTINVKDGNYKSSVGSSDSYYVVKEKKIYVKYKDIDTLYWMDYSSDTNKVISVSKSDSIFPVNNIKCKSISLKTNAYDIRFLYTNEFYINPDHDQDNTIGNLNVFSRETGGGVWLSYVKEYESVVLSTSCIHIEQKNVDSHIFDLPNLPKKNIKDARLFVPARLSGSSNAWAIYLQNNLRSALAIKYLKLPKGQDTASQKVLVNFTVEEDGTISNIQVLNKDEVHPRLAEEAMRVIRESPKWLPATLYGIKIKSFPTQPVIFAVSK